MGSNALKAKPLGAQVIGQQAAAAAQRGHAHWLGWAGLDQQCTTQNL
jgi:hypothetical protein